MKRIYDIMRLAWLAAALLLVSCSDTGEELTAVAEGSVVYPNLQINVAEMSMTAASRAAEPMRPDQENYVRTIAVFEFDNEGLHEKGSCTYHFIDYTNGTVDGATGVVNRTELGIVETHLNGLALTAYSNGTLCLVANVTEDEVDAFYQNISTTTGQSYGTMTLDEFKTWALPFDYMESPSDVYDESTSGHITNMYMFGYFEGNIVPAKVGEIRVDLGRLASRIDITIVNETGAAIEKRLGYHFDNVCKSAYFFPILSGVPPTIGAGIVRTVICAGTGNPVEGDPDFQIVKETFPDKGVHTRYYYTAAHSAKDWDDATKLHLFYDRPILGDDAQQGDDSSVRIPLCNVHPSQAAEVDNGYSLSRNTCYHFTIRLKPKPTSSTPARSSAPAIEYTDTPGEIIVYLP